MPPLIEQVVQNDVDAVNESKSGPYGSAPQPAINMRCPTCGCSIFIGSGGYLTCTGLKCTRPDVERVIAERIAHSERAQRVAWLVSDYLDLLLSWGAGSRKRNPLGEEVIQPMLAELWGGPKREEKA